jgi:hypothetical protein
VELAHPASSARVSPVWRLWPYAVLQFVVTLAIFVPPTIPWLDAAMAGTFFLFARSQPGARAWGIWGLLAVGIVLAGRPTGVEAVIRAAGFAGILVLAFQASRRDAPAATRDRSREAVGICLALPIIDYSLVLLRDLHPATYDPILARIDAWAPPIAWALARALKSDQALRLVCQITYYALPLALVLVAEAERARTPRRGSVFVSAALAGFLGVLAYQLVPATGPLYAFAGYPGERPLVGTFALAMPAYPAVPRNAMPSLHLTWALLVAWHATRAGRLVGTLGMIFLVITAVATLGMGEHYAIDLVMALPFATGVVAAVAGHRRLAGASFLAVAIGLLLIAATAWSSF